MTTPYPTHGKALRIAVKADTPENLTLAAVDASIPSLPPGHALVQVQAAAINPSDVKAALGLMPHAAWPRTPGRDYAGRVIAGPADWLGTEVWGTGGDLGITRDGTHAQYLMVPTSALARKPAVLQVTEAATVGVPFITAHEGLRRAGLRGAGQTVVVFGAHGKVGQAAIQIATQQGARAVGVDRGGQRYDGHASSQVDYLDGQDPELSAQLRRIVGERGADIAYNTVGSPYFANALDILAVGGTQVLISTIERTVPLDILAFYRRNLNLLGVDTLKLSATDCANVLAQLTPGFESGELRAFGIDTARLIPLDQATDAYRQVLQGSRDRVVLTP